MTSGLAVDELRARFSAAASRSSYVIDRSTRLCAAARRNQVRAERTRMDARARRDVRPRRASLGIEGFRVEGLVDGQPVSAVLSGGRLECHPELLARAELVVALGETFGGGELSHVTASLTNGPTAMFLTVMRAMCIVHSVEFTHQLPGPPLSAGDATL